MARCRTPVLLDTNAIIEAHRVGGWRALANGYQLETVEECITETQTGALNRPPEQRIDAKLLRASLGKVHDPKKRKHFLMLDESCKRRDAAS